MKHYKKILVGFYVILVGLLWTGCSYDKSISEPFQYSTIYIPQAYAGPISNELIIKEEEDEFPLGAAFGGVEELKSDAIITFKVANELIDEYNDINNTNYSKMPEGSYELSGTEVTLHKGTTTSDVIKLKVKTLGHLEKGKTYLLPITISDVSVDIPINAKLKTVYHIIEAVALYRNSTVYIPQASNGAVFKKVAARVPKEEGDIFQFGVTYEGAIELNKDAKVTFKVANELIGDYNLANNKTYLQMPAGSYELSEIEAIIKKGTTVSELLKLKVKAFGNLETGKTYILPISVSDVSLDIPVDPERNIVYYIFEASEYAPIDRTSWRIHDISGDENEYTRGGRGIHSIDGDVNTIWSTQWRGDNPLPKLPPPYYITYDMGKRETIYGTILMFRRANNGTAVVYNVNGVYNSIPKDISIEISDNGVVWSPVTTVVLPIILQNEVFFGKAVQGRYLKLTINSIRAPTTGTLQATLAEFNAF